MVTEAIDFRFLLLENYKKLTLRENDVTTILMIDHFITNGNPFVTADLLSLKMTMDVKEIDTILANLLTRGFLEYRTMNGTTVTTLEPLKEKLYREFQISVSRDLETQSSSQENKTLENIYGQFEKLLGRTLSPVEFSKIREWVSYGYTDEMILNALKDALSKGKKSLRSVDKILLSYETREDLESEGHTTLAPDWNKNLAETIRIAKTPWLDDDDDESK